MQSTAKTALDPDLVRLEDADFYLDDPHAVFERMRAEAPVFWYAPVGFWVVTRQEEIKEVSKSPKFTSKYGTIINDYKYAQVVRNEFLEKGAEFLTYLDPPRHTAMRKIINPSFGAAMVSRLEGRVRAIVGDILDAVPPDGAIDFVRTVALPVPLTVIAELLGLRAYDIGQLGRWSDYFMSAGHAVEQEQIQVFGERVEAMRAYFREEIEAQRKEPQDGVIAELLSAEVGGERFDDESLVAFCQLLLVAGNETTRSSLAAQMHLLIENPEQLARLSRDPSLCARAAEETIRYFTPTIGFMRVATEDLTIGDQLIKEGQPVYMIYASGNRDEAVFENPNAYDVARRNSAAHCGFGAGWHFCVGAALARLEIRVVFEELLKRWSGFELRGDPIRTRSILNNAYVSLPVRLIRK